MKPGQHVIPGQKLSRHVTKNNSSAHIIYQLVPGQQLLRVTRLGRQGHSPSRVNFSSCTLCQFLPKPLKLRLKQHFDDAGGHKSLLFDGRYYQEYIYICYLPDRRSGWGETVPELLKTARARRGQTIKLQAMPL